MGELTFQTHSIDTFCEMSQVQEDGQPAGAPRRAPVRTRFGFVYDSVYQSTLDAVYVCVVYAPPTLEVTQGKLVSQSPTDATRFWRHLYGSCLKKLSICPWVASRVVSRACRPSTLLMAPLSLLHACNPPPRSIVVHSHSCSF